MGLVLTLGATVHETSQSHADGVDGGAPGQSAKAQEGTDAPNATMIADANRVTESARQLLASVGEVTAEEFHWQESHYDHDSKYGRELLYLIANHEWVRATSETVGLSRSDAVDTTIKIDVDLEQITHEAFRKRVGLLWIPITVLPSQPVAGVPSGSGRQRLEPDPFATVTTAAGDLLPLMTIADVRHQISAAMAEIIVNMGVARWPDPDGERPIATRDQRLLLSAAIYRSLRRGGWAGRSAASSSPDEAPDAGVPASRLNNTRRTLNDLLNHYYQLLLASNELNHTQAGKFIASGEPQFAPELARRAVMVLRALADSVLVVVPIDRATPPTVLTVKVPTRSLHSPRVSKLIQPSTWMLRPLGRLEIDVLLPTADADRQVEIHLPDGVSFEEIHSHESDETSLPRMDIDVRRPQPLRDLAALMGQVLDPGQSVPALSLKRCLADLAASKVASARETLRQYNVTAAEGVSFTSVHARQTATSEARSTLAKLQTALAHPYREDGTLAADLETSWTSFKRETTSFCRRASAERPSPHTVVARAEMIEDVYQRATPKSAKIYCNIAVADSEYFSIARFSGRMSLLLMTVVLAFLAISRLANLGAILSPEVLAIVLTLFSAIQAGQMEARDRSTIHGLLSAAGNWLIAASILPAVILAVALAFSRVGWAPTIWALICVSLQLLFQMAMLRGPLTPSGSPRAKQRRRFHTEQPDYHSFEALRSDYWRTTTADALVIGRAAYAYVVWQKGGVGQETPQLRPLLSWRSNYPVPGELANVMALLRTGTLGQAMTFVVFRQEPDANWLENATIAQPDFDPDRLAPMESITSVVDVFVGIRRHETLSIAHHPLKLVLNAAARRLIVLDAQLPVPIPVPNYGGRLWARIRVGLRNAGDIHQLAPFLKEIYEPPIVNSNGEHPHVVAVQTARTVPPRVIVASRESRTRKSHPVLSSDLDITRTVGRNESAEARTWRLLTFCSDARSNIESDIINKMADAAGEHVQLVGLTYALLHGMAIMTMLVHVPEEYVESESNFETKLSHEIGQKFQLLINERLSRNELAPPVEFPLIRVHFRWQDRPGAILNVLDSLSKTLVDQFPSISEHLWSVSYARTQAPAGRAAVARLTLRIHTPPSNLSSWNPDSEEIERKVRTRAALEAAAERFAGSPDENRDIPEDPVISVNLIRTPGAGDDVY